MHCSLYTLLTVTHSVSVMETMALIYVERFTWCTIDYMHRLYVYWCTSRRSATLETQTYARETQ